MYTRKWSELNDIEIINNGGFRVLSRSDSGSLAKTRLSPSFTSFLRVWNRMYPTFTLSSVITTLVHIKIVKVNGKC